MKKPAVVTAGIIFIIVLCGSAELRKPKFSFEENENGITLSEKEEIVFFYQKKAKSPNNKVFFNNYLHPVYNLKGEIITEEFPPDHLHHRGFFWAWHQLYAGSGSIGDQWMMENIIQDVVRVEKKTIGRNAILKATVMIRSENYQQGKAFIEEQTTIVVHPREKDLRLIDFEIVLKPLVSGLSIGGSDDEKGYGGFCVRVKLPKGTVFTSDKGKVTPQNLQIKAGPWMDISSDHGSGMNGVTILCHKSSPNYPAPWILRQEKSMQNIVFPGRERISLDKPVTLRYRVIIHNGDAGSLDLASLQSDYDNSY